MQDLLTEEDFLAPKTSHNPLRLFWPFYLILLLQIVGVSVAIGFFDYSNDLVVGFCFIFLPLIMAFIMFFFKKENALLPLKTIALSVVILLSIFYIPMFTVAAFSGDIAYGLALCGGILVINLALCCAIMLPYARLKQKNRLTFK